MSSDIAPSKSPGMEEECARYLTCMNVTPSVLPMVSAVMENGKNKFAGSQRKELTVRARNLTGDCDSRPPRRKGSHAWRLRPASAPGLYPPAESGRAGRCWRLR